MADLLAPLTSEQNALLLTISEPYLKHEKWPTFAYVSRELRKQGLDARQVLRSMPATTAYSAVNNRGYSAVVFDQIFRPDSELWLTVVGFAQTPALMPRVESFLLAIEKLRIYLEAHSSSPFEVAPVFVHCADMSDNTVANFSPPFARQLMGMLIHEPVTFFDAYEVASDSSSWKLTLSQTLLEFEGARSVDQYVERVIEILGIDVSLVDTADEASSSEPMAAVPLYVAAENIASLRAIPPSSAFNVTKFIQLVEELNGCFELDYAFSCHTLLRALLDHLPPLFGCKKYSEVVSNLSWADTDRKYLRRLGNFRNQADDVLHSQIGKRPNLLTMDDLPPRAAVNVLIAAAVDRLQPGSECYSMS